MSHCKSNIAFQDFKYYHQKQTANPQIAIIICNIQTAKLYKTGKTTKKSNSSLFSRKLQPKSNRNRPWDYKKTQWQRKWEKNDDDNDDDSDLHRAAIKIRCEGNKPFYTVSK